MKQVVLYFIILLTVPLISMAQESSDMIILDDSLALGMSSIESFESVSKLDPNKSAFFSAVVPGLGQVYNKQYWKLPILYGGGILIGHLIKYNSNYYNAFRNAYIAETDGDDSTENPFPRFSESSLERRTEQFERDRNFIIIIGAVLYLLNIVDAHVATHLNEFDINEDLSFRPSFQSQTKFTAQSLGVSLVFQLSK